MNGISALSEKFLLKNKKFFWQGTNDIEPLLTGAFRIS